MIWCWPTPARATLKRRYEFDWAVLRPAAEASLLIYLQLVGGLVILLLGGDFLVRGAVALARRLGVSPLVIGLTVVAFGTSAPELIVSVEAALGGVPGLAIGNVVGSNVANVFLVLGAPAVVFPIVCQASSLNRDVHRDDRRQSALRRVLLGRCPGGLGKARYWWFFSSPSSSIRTYRSAVTVAVTKNTVKSSTVSPRFLGRCSCSWDLLRSDWRDCCSGPTS